MSEPTKEDAADPEATEAVTAENKSAFGAFVKQLFSFSGDLRLLPPALV